MPLLVVPPPSANTSVLPPFGIETEDRPRHAAARPQDHVDRLVGQDGEHHPRRARAVAEGEPARAVIEQIQLDVGPLR